MSDDFFVPEEVLEVGNLQVGTYAHDEDGYDSEDQHAGLDLLVLFLETFLVLDQIRELLSQLLYHVLDLLGLYFDRSKMLLRNDIRVIFCLDASLDHELEVLRSVFFVENAHLVVSSNVRGELVSQLWHVFLFLLDREALTSRLSWRPLGSLTVI